MLCFVEFGARDIKQTDVVLTSYLSKKLDPKLRVSHTQYLPNARFAQKRNSSLRVLVEWDSLNYNGVYKNNLIKVTPRLKNDYFLLLLPHWEQNCQVSVGSKCRINFFRHIGCSADLISFRLIRCNTFWSLGKIWNQSSLCKLLTAGLLLCAFRD